MIVKIGGDLSCIPGKRRKHGAFFLPREINTAYNEERMVSKMKEWMAWTIIVGCLYFAVYLIVGTTVNTIWQKWAKQKTNMFLRYNLLYEIKKIYPKVYRFIADYHWLYNVLYVCFWPIVVPLQYSICTKAVKQSLRQICYY